MGENSFHLCDRGEVGFRLEIHSLQPETNFTALSDSERPTARRQVYFITKSVVKKIIFRIESTPFIHIVHGNILLCLYVLNWRKSETLWGSGLQQLSHETLPAPEGSQCGTYIYMEKCTSTHKEKCRSGLNRSKSG